jgi:glycosyltransferase involved in cell wall biosynthesis
MKIVSVMTTASRGGGEYAAADLLEALAQRGHDCVMLTNEPTIVDGTSIAARPLELGPKLARRSAVRLATRWRSLVARLREALEAEMPYDVLLVHYKKEQLLVPALPAHLRRRVVWAEWGPVPSALRSGPGALIYRRAARDVAAVMAVSAGTRESVISAGVPAERVTVVPNVMDPQAVVFDAAARAAVRKRLGIPPEAFVVGCVSRLHPKKRNDVIVRAAQLLDGDAHVVIAGDGEEEAVLRALAQPLGDRAHFLPTPHRTIAEVLSALDVSVFCPSPTEGAPRAVIYAMLASRPVVSTGREGVADMIHPGIGAIVSPENDPAALAAVLRPYAADPERVLREGAEGRRVAIERYDGARIAQQIERLIAPAGADAATAAS